MQPWIRPRLSQPKNSTKSSHACCKLSSTIFILKCLVNSSTNFTAPVMVSQRTCIWYTYDRFCDKRCPFYVGIPPSMVYLPLANTVSAVFISGLKYTSRGIVVWSLRCISFYGKLRFEVDNISTCEAVISRLVIGTLNIYFTIKLLIIGLNWSNLTAVFFPSWRTFSHRSRKLNTRASRGLRVCKNSARTVL